MERVVHPSPPPSPFPAPLHPPPHRGALCWHVPPPLLGHNVDQHRANCLCRLDLYNGTTQQAKTALWEGHFTGFTGVGGEAFIGFSSSSSRWRKDPGTDYTLPPTHTHTYTITRGAHGGRGSHTAHTAVAFKCYTHEKIPPTPLFTLHPPPSPFRTPTVEHGHQVIHVVPVQRADVVEAQLLKQG